MSLQNPPPLVSVIIPTYNYAFYINEAIDSVLNSNFPQDEIEIIVIDDGSKDNTSEIVAAYGNRVKYIFQQNSGKAWATKIGIDNCHGKYCFNLDADDIFLPDKIQEVVQIFEQDSDIVHVAHSALYWKIDENIKVPELIPQSIIGRKISGRELLSYFYRKNMLFGGGSTFAARTYILKNIHIPKEVDMYIDEYLVLFTLSQGYSFFLDSPFSLWRIHGNNFSDSSSNEDISQSKVRRSIDSQEAILSNLLISSLPEDVKQLYFLRTKVAKIAAKENNGKKEFADVLDMWSKIIENLKIFKYDSLSIINNYTILNRSIPITIFRPLKKLKGTLEIWKKH